MAPTNRRRIFTPPPQSPPEPEAVKTTEDAVVAIIDWMTNLDVRVVALERRQGIDPSRALPPIGKFATVNEALLFLLARTGNAIAAAELRKSMARDLDGFRDD